MFKWSCLAVAAVSVGALTWAVSNVSRGIRDLHQEVREARQEIRDARPRLTLEGEVAVETDAVGVGMTVSYHPRFASPPHLTFSPDGPPGWQVTVQAADSFSVSRTGPGVKTFRWKAEGYPAKAKLEEQNEAILQALQRLHLESLTQAAARRSENEAVVRELRGIRQELRPGAEGKGAK